MRAKSVIAYFSWMVASSWKKRPSTNFSALSPPLLPLGGRGPQTIAAALGRDAFESGSDSKSVLVRGSSLYPIYRKSSRMATRFAMFFRFENAAGGARRRLLPRLIGTLLKREAIQKLCWFGAAVCTQFTANRVEWRRDLLCSFVLRMRRAVPADDCCRAWSGRF